MKIMRLKRAPIIAPELSGRGLTKEEVEKVNDQHFGGNGSFPPIIYGTSAPQMMQKVKQSKKTNTEPAHLTEAMDLSPAPQR